MEYTIDTMGKVSNIEINPSYIHTDHLIKDSMVEYEISRVIRLMPQWAPAFQNGLKVKQKFLFTIKIPYLDFKCCKLTPDTTIHLNVDIRSDFKYGFENSIKTRIEAFVNDHLQWPSEMDCYGMVTILGIVECDGKLSNLIIVRGLCSEYDEEALTQVETYGDKKN